MKKIIPIIPHLILYVFILIVLSMVVSAATTISTCTNIVASGEYLLDTDIIGSSLNKCMNITIDNVTLNCQGYIVNGTATTGIYSEDNKNITVKHCKVSGWGDDGIYFLRTNYSTIYNVSMQQSTNNIHLSDSYNNVIYNSVVNNTIPIASQVGVWLEDSSHNHIYNITSMGCDYYGIELLAFSLTVINNTIENSTFKENVLGGIYLYDADENIVRNNIIKNNTDSGLKSRRM